MIKIYGPTRSSASRCYAMLEELGLPYEVAPLDLMGGGTDQPEYLRLNPNAKVPCLVDGKTILWESVAINLYLAEKYRPSMMGTTPEQRGQVYQWSMWSMTEFQPPLIDLLIQMMFVPEAKRDLALIDQAKAQIPGLLKILDDALGGGTYIAGTEYTVADLNLASVANIAVILKQDLEPFKNLTRWLEIVNARPAWKKLAQLRAV